MTAQTVRIPSAGEELEALLYLPTGAPPYPFVVMAGGWCYVKEIVDAAPRRRARLRAPA